jgi:tetratricopeptide (TPR) repeat protein
MRATRRAAAVLLVLAISACAPKVAPVAPPASPRFPGYPEPVVPAALEASPDLRARHAAAWRRLQSGDVRGAARAFTDILRAQPAFYPAEAGLGFVRLADRDPDQAAVRFAAAAAKDDAYLPAWVGLADARIAAGRDADAIAALEKVIALDPTATEARARLDLLRFRQLPSLIEGGQRARRAGQAAEARRLLGQALALSPASGVIHLELALVELDAGDMAAALRHARRATEVDPNNAEAHAALARTFEAAGNPSGAAAAYARAVEIDPRPEWRERVAALSERADLAVIPAEFREVPTAATVTRAQVAAYLGTRLDALIARAPARSTSVATDIRGHWAAPWILPVTRAGIMEIQPNHTFQPAETLRRGDLAQVVSRLLALIPQRQMDLARWRAAKPRFADLPATNVFYPSAALAVAAGAMSTRAGSRFDATQPASGPDLAAAVARIEQISGR